MADRDLKGHFVKGHTPWHKGKKGVYDPKVKVRMSKSYFKKGQKPWNVGKTFSDATKLKMSKIKIGKYTGQNSPNWRGGITPINKQLRNSREYKLWRKAVFERDNYICVWCGTIGNGHNLNADHIKPFFAFPELRFAIDNGRTLCVPCHKKTDTYLWKAQKKYAR